LCLKLEEFIDNVGDNHAAKKLVSADRRFRLSWTRPCKEFFSNNDRQCRLHLEVYQIAILHCALWNNKQYNII